MPYRSKYLVKCPFYDHDFGNGVYCEGVGMAKKTHLQFENDDIMDTWVKNNCLNEIPVECPIFRALAEKYEKDC